MKRTQVDRRWAEQGQPKESEEGGGMAQWAKALAEQVYQPEFKSQDPSKKPGTGVHIGSPGTPMTRWGAEAGEPPGSSWAN